MDYVLLAVNKVSIVDSRITGCYLMEKPEGDPPYESASLADAIKVEFDPEFTGTTTAEALEELTRLGYSVELSSFSY